MEIFAVWSLSPLVSLYPTTILLRVAGAIRAWIQALGSTETFLGPLSCSGRGKIHKPTQSTGSEQNLLRVPFLLESQARPGEKETGKQSDKLGGESTNPPQAIRVGKRTFIYGSLELLSKGTRVLQLQVFLCLELLLSSLASSQAAIRNHQTSDSWLP